MNERRDGVGDAEPPLVVLLGPTAVGKTALSLALCQQFDGEIINADSRQIYRYMNIGTAKPAAAELESAPHHLVDFCEPDAILTVATYQELAYAAIGEIHQRGHVPFLVGGTALYVRAVVEGLRIPEVPPDPPLREELERQLEQEGVAGLFERLQKLDPATAEVIDARNPRRLLRALEIIMVTGRSKVELEGATPPPYRILSIGLDRPRDELYMRTDARIDAMVAEGLVEETAQLLQSGYATNLPAMTSLGYREIAAALGGEMTLDAAMAKIKTETHRFVRRQYTAFRKLKKVEWYDLSEPDAPAQITQRVAEFLGKSS
jgi:tRNA dimethylallyltransferase